MPSPGKVHLVSLHVTLIFDILTSKCNHFTEMVNLVKLSQLVCKILCWPHTEFLPYWSRDTDR